MGGSIEGCHPRSFLLHLHLDSFVFLPATPPPTFPFPSEAVLCAHWRPLHGVVNTTDGKREDGREEDGRGGPVLSERKCAVTRGAR